MSCEDEELKARIAETEHEFQAALAKIDEDTARLKAQTEGLNTAMAGRVLTDIRRDIARIDRNIEQGRQLLESAHDLNPETEALVREALAAAPQHRADLVKTAELLSAASGIAGTA